MEELTTQPGTETEEPVQAIRRKILEYERWFRFLDGQNRVLERERQKLSAVLNHMDAGFLVMDPSLNVVWANEVFGRHFMRGQSGSFIGSACHSVLCRGESACSTCPVAGTFQSSRVAHHEIRIEIDGNPRDLYATAMPLRSPFGDTEEVIVMLQDVSDLQILRTS